MWKRGVGTHGLLESVAEELGCDYLSDLRWKSRRLSLYIALKELPAEYFSSHEWTDAAQYLTGGWMPENLTAAQAKALLLVGLNGIGSTAIEGRGK